MAGHHEEFGAREWGRTITALRPPDFESGASASSATRALRESYHALRFPMSPGNSPRFLRAGPRAFAALPRRGRGQAVALRRDCLSNTRRQSHSCHTLVTLSSVNFRTSLLFRNHQPGDSLATETIFLVHQVGLFCVRPSMLRQGEPHGSAPHPVVR